MMEKKNIFAARLCLSNDFESPYQKYRIQHGIIIQEI